MTEGQPIDFGVVEAGMEQTKTIWIYNDTDAELQDITVEPTEDIPHLTVIGKPNMVMPMNHSTIVLRWSPPVDFRRALKATVKINAKELYKP